MMYLPAWLAIPDRAWIPDRPPLVVGRHCSTFPIDCGMGGGKLFVTWAVGNMGTIWNPLQVIFPNSTGKITGI